MVPALGVLANTESNNITVHPGTGAAGLEGNLLVNGGFEHLGKPLYGATVSGLMIGFRYRLSEEATVRLAFERRSRHGRRFAREGALRRSGRSGANAVAFSGRVSRHILRPGRYRVRITARDAAGNRTTTGYRAFRVTRRGAVR